MSRRFVKVWAPASADVNTYKVGRLAAGSELVKWIGPSMIVSRRPLYMAVTVAVNGTPAVTVAGAVTRRMACEETPQLTVSRVAIIALKLRKRCDRPF